MQFTSLIPLLDVHDVEAAIEFYKDALGFCLEDKLSWGGRTEWALLRSGQVELMLNAKTETSHRFPENARGGVFFFYPDDIEGLHQSLTKKGYAVSSLLETCPGTHEFCVQDPDGHVLWFSRRRVNPDEVTVGDDVVTGVEEGKVAVHIQL